MEMAPGKSIDSPDFSPEERREMALAYTMVELTNLMGGKAWDIDRHSKQQNFHVTTDKNGKKVVEIGIFDTGAQRPQPTNKEKELLGKFLIAIAKQQMSGADNNLGEFMLERIKKFEKAGKDVTVLLEHYAPKYDVIPGKHLVKEAAAKADLFLALDCGDEGRLGAAADWFHQADVTINIDHHSSNTYYGQYNYVEGEASSTSEIVYGFLEGNYPVDQDMAAGLYAGLIYDTGGSSVERFCLPVAFSQDER